MMASGEYPAVLYDFVLAVGIAEVFTADDALPVFGVARLSAGGVLRLMMLHGVACRNHQTVHSDSVCAFCIGEILLASGAIPVGAVARFRAGSRHCGISLQRGRMRRSIGAFSLIPSDRFRKTLLTIGISLKSSLLIAAGYASGRFSRHVADQLCMQRCWGRAGIAGKSDGDRPAGTVILRYAPGGIAPYVNARSGGFIHTIGVTATGAGICSISLLTASRLRDDRYVVMT